MLEVFFCGAKVIIIGGTDKKQTVFSLDLAKTIFDSQKTKDGSFVLCYQLT